VEKYAIYWPQFFAFLRVLQKNETFVGVCFFLILVAQKMLALLAVCHKHSQLTRPLLSSLRQI